MEERNKSLICLYAVFSFNIVLLAPTITIIVHIHHRIAAIITITHTNWLETSLGNFLQPLLPYQICLQTSLC